MSKIKTITATTTEQTITFDATYQFVWFRSLGDGDVLVSDHSGIVAGTDDVALVKGGDSTRITVPYNKTVYVKAVSDSVDMEIHAQNFSDAPFEGGSGGGGGGSITIDPTPTQGSSNAVSSGGVYTALQGVGGFTRTVLYDSGSYSQHIPYQQDVALSDNSSNYDIIALVICIPSDNSAGSMYSTNMAFFDVSHIMQSNVFGRWEGNKEKNLSFFVTDTAIKQSWAYSSPSGSEPYIYKVIGYKFG